MNQQLEHLTSDLKDTKERVMDLMSKNEVQDVITKTIKKKVLTSVEKKTEELIDENIKEKTKKVEDKVELLEFDNKNLTDRLTQAETNLESQKNRITELEKIAVASAQRNNYNEQYSRKNNVKILNVPEDALETEGTLAEVVCTTLCPRAM